MSEPSTGDHVNIVGGGLAGALLAILLGRQGLRVTLFDRRVDPRTSAVERGRSINLALAARGIAALQRAAVFESIRPILIPMRGRMIHDEHGGSELQLYGQNEREVIYSVSRGSLNRALIEQAAKLPNIELRFEQHCLGARPTYGSLHFEDLRAGHAYEIALAPTIAADGAGSGIRKSLEQLGEIEAREELLDHDYKELEIPASHARGLDPHALHIWPRGGFMLIALPNPGGSFTATLFLPKHGPDSFAGLRTRAAVQAFFTRHFPTAVPLLPALLEDFLANPQGILGTVHCNRWHLGGELLLLGDAAHAIVPFHGQGMNCAFEDCTALLDGLKDGHGAAGGWPERFAAFERLRRPNTEAIAHMALENYEEMRAAVLAPEYLRSRALALLLERRHPRRFIPRYSMVMFHAEIPYAEALRRGSVQQQILSRMDRSGVRADAADAAERIAAFDSEIERLLPPVSGSAESAPA